MTMKLSAPNDKSSFQSLFNGRTLLKYLAIHVLIGLVFQFIPFDKVQWLNDLFIALDTALPAFRTLFFNSKNPLACKVMLLLWWFVLLPWGFILARRFFVAPLHREGGPAPVAKMFYFILGVFFAFYFMSANSFAEHSIEVPLHVTRIHVHYITLRHGPIGVSIYLIVSSLGVIGGSCISTLMARSFFLNGSSKDKL